VKDDLAEDADKLMHWLRSKRGIDVVSRIGYLQIKIVFF